MGSGSDSSPPSPRALAGRTFDVYLHAPGPAALVAFLRRLQPQPASDRSPVATLVRGASAVLALELGTPEAQAGQILGDLLRAVAAEAGFRVEFPTEAPVVTEKAALGAFLQARAAALAPRTRPLDAPESPLWVEGGVPTSLSAPPSAWGGISLLAVAMVLCVLVGTGVAFVLFLRAWGKGAH